MSSIIAWFQRSEEPRLCSASYQQSRSAPRKNLEREAALQADGGDFGYGDGHVHAAAQCPARVGAGTKWELREVRHSFLASGKQGGVVNGTPEVLRSHCVLA